MMKNHQNKIEWVLLNRYHIYGFAEMTKQILEDNNIPCLLQKDVISTIFSVSSNDAGNFAKIFVPKQMLELAKQILESPDES